MQTTVKKNSVQKKVFTKFRLRTFSRHPSHRPFRTEIPLLPFRAALRMGSCTQVENTVAKGGKVVELNTIQGLKNSADKLLMKKCFQLAGVQTADWFLLGKDNKFYQQVGIEKDPVQIDISKLPYPIVAKHRLGSRGSGNFKLDSQKDLESWIRSKDTSNYIFEKFYNYDREYRLHITEDGCFYTCRKMLKKDTPEKDKWFRNDSNSVWILETNPTFDKPVNWDAIITECIKAQDAMELDLCSFDVRVQSAESKGKKRDKCDFIVIESNSASSMAPVVLQRYIETIPKLAYKKAKEYGVWLKD